jgi:hypothetical protein
MDASQLNRDSAILLNAGGTGFFDPDDCKLFDIVP